MGRRGQPIAKRTAKARCLSCDDVVESIRHGENMTCSCGALTVGGGLRGVYIASQAAVGFEALPGRSEDDLRKAGLLKT